MSTRRARGGRRGGGGGRSRREATGKNLWACVHRADRSLQPRALVATDRYVEAGAGTGALGRYILNVWAFGACRCTTSMPSPWAAQPMALPPEKGPTRPGGGSPRGAVCKRPSVRGPLQALPSGPPHSLSDLLDLCDWFRGDQHCGTQPNPPGPPVHLDSAPSRSPCPCCAAERSKGTPLHNTAFDKSLCSPTSFKHLHLLAFTCSQNHHHSSHATPDLVLSLLPFPNFRPFQSPTPLSALLSSIQTPPYLDIPSPGSTQLVC